MHATRTLRLTTRDYAIIEDVARFRFLSSYHLERRHFPKESRHRHIVTLNCLARLVKRGYLTMGQAYPRWVPGKTQHKIAVYTWLPANQAALRRHLEAEARANLGDERYAQHAERIPSTKTFSPFTMFHELLLTDFLLWLEAAAKREGWTVAFWERYGPREEDVTGVFSTREGTRRFNPDGLLCLRSPEHRHYFRAVEADKNSTSLEGKYREKLEGHVLAQSSGHYTALLRRKIEDYHLPVTEPEKVSNVVLTVTHTRERRNDLLIETASLGEPFRFLFACVDDLYPDEGFGAAWLRHQDYFALVTHEQYPEHALPSVRKAWLAEHLEAMPKAPPVPKGAT